MATEEPGVPTPGPPRSYFVGMRSVGVRLAEDRLGETLDLLVEHYGVERVQEALRPHRRSAHRPEGTEIDDSLALASMFFLIYTGQAADRTKAARSSASLTTGNSIDSTIRRLRDKYNHGAEYVGFGTLAPLRLPEGMDPQALRWLVKKLQERNEQIIADYGE